jgi:hypothetical protein
MVVTISSPVEGSVYPKNSTVPIVVNVTREDSSVVAGASVLFTVTPPSGSPTQKTVIADSSGRATWNYKITPKAVSGSYTVTARATLNGESTDAVPVHFNVSP